MLKDLDDMSTSNVTMNPERGLGHAHSFAVSLMMRPSLFLALFTLYMDQRDEK